MMGRIWKVLTRKKAIDPVTVEETRLSRVLNVFDLTALGVGSTLGVGVYVLAGQVAKTTAGPSVVLSFLIAAIASVFAGLCYAEFGARAPRAGSAYIYSYVCVGEFIAFVIGWNLILEYVIGSASVARGLSLYLDTLINNTLQDTFRDIAPINVAYLASYFDFFSFGISILLAICLAFGLKESSMANNIVTCLNVAVVLFIIIAGSLKADPANWRISPNNTNVTNSTIIGSGGFFPFGVENMIKGAATCFYGFVGFDCIATTGEEVKNPRKAIPFSIIVSLLIIFLAYFGVATVLTLMVPYYLQDYNAPIPRAFEMVGWEVAKWIVAIGAIFGLCASLFGAMFPLPRIIYAMGSDGLVFKFLAKVHPKFQTPVIGTILAGFLTGLMSALFDLSQLVNMMSIGTLQAYTIVAASVLLLRYTEEVKKVYIPIKTSSDTESVSSESSIDDKYNDDGIRQNFDGPTTSDEQELLANDSPSFWRSLKYIINCRIREPNRITENIVTCEVLLYCILCVGISLCVIYLRTDIANGETWAIVITSIIVGLTILVLLSMVTQPQSKKELSFKVPLLPFIPALSIMVNIYLMLMLDYRTWIRFAVWMALGIPMYCVCACADKTPSKPQNGGNYATNITNGHTKMSNGTPNPTFVYTEPAGEERRPRTIKKKTAPPPPTIFEQTENIEVQQQAVIADLEDMLEKEEAISQLDDVLNNEMFRINDNKLSADSLSNSSALVSQSEDVVADVHCANVVTPVADPASLPFPIQSNPPPYVGIDQNNKNPSDVVSLNDSSNDDVIEPEPSEVTEKRSKELTLDLNNKSNRIFQDGGDDFSPQVYDVTTSNIPLETVILTSDALEEGIEAVLNRPIVSSAQHDDTNGSPPGNEEILEGNEDSQKYSAINSSNKPVVSFEDTTSSLQANLDTAEDTKDSQNNFTSQKSEPVASSYVPSDEALKTVTLRRVEKQIKQIEPTSNQNASDDHLKVGSKEYKDFVKNLDTTLKTAPLPTFFVPRKGVVVEPKPVIPNENVINNPIDRVEAKEKLKQHYATRNIREEPILSPRPNTPKPALHGSKSLDETLLLPPSTESNTTPSLDSNLSSSQTDVSSAKSDSELQDHKSKMENVFNSIKLKKLETQGDEQSKRRLSKSLGSSFAKEDDRTDHKQKMGNIFNSIKAIRKDSLK